jgi:large subunit ribosomal protein L10
VERRKDSSYSPALRAVPRNGRSSLCRQNQVKEGGKTNLAISKEKKRAIVAELKELLASSKATVISDYRGLTATQMGGLRNTLRPLNSRFLVAKNTLVLRSLDEVGLPHPEEMLQGPTALGFCFDDVSQPLRALMEFARETDSLTIKGGLLGDRIIDAAQVRTLSALPGIETLRAQTLSGLQSPASGFVGMLDAALRGLLYAFDAQAQKLGNAQV